MKLRNRKIIITLLLILSFACKEAGEALNTLFLPDGGRMPEVVAVYPTEGMSGVNGAENLWVLFNKPMDKQKTQSAFSLSSTSGSVNGRFQWEGNKMIFIPQEQLSGGDEHTMIAGRGSESEAGINLKEDFVVRFFPVADHYKPRFISASPVNGATDVAPDVNITLRFSEPIDFETIDDGLSITPPILSTTTTNDDRTEIIIMPAVPLTNGTYTVNINQGLKDDVGNMLQEEVSLSFVVGNDYIYPSVIAVDIGGLSLVEGLWTAGAERRDPITIQFSEPMDRVRTEGAVTISPAAPVNRTWNGAGDMLTLTFPDPLQSETYYTLNVNNGARDVARNNLDRNYEFPFITDGQSSVRPRVLQVRQQDSTIPGGGDGAAPAPAYSLPLGDLDPLDTAQLIDLDPLPGSYMKGIYLEIEFDKEMVVNSLAVATSFTEIFDDSTGDVRIHDIEVNGNRVTLMLYLYSIPGDIGNGTPTYSLRIKGGTGGAYDSNGNTLKSDFVLIVEF